VKHSLRLIFRAIPVFSSASKPRGSEIGFVPFTRLHYDVRDLTQLFRLSELVSKPGQMFSLSSHLKKELESVSETLWFEMVQWTTSTLSVQKLRLRILQWLSCKQLNFMKHIQGELFTEDSPFQRLLINIGICVAFDIINTLYIQIQLRRTGLLKQAIIVVMTSSSNLVLIISTD
jgi:hypothetical protein